MRLWFFLLFIWSFICLCLHKIVTQLDHNWWLEMWSATGTETQHCSLIFNETSGDTAAAVVDVVGATESFILFVYLVFLDSILEFEVGTGSTLLQSKCSCSCQSRFQQLQHTCRQNPSDFDAVPVRFGVNEWLEHVWGGVIHKVTSLCDFTLYISTHGMNGWLELTVA